MRPAAPREGTAPGLRRPATCRAGLSAPAVVLSPAARPRTPRPFRRGRATGPPDTAPRLARPRGGAHLAAMDPARTGRPSRPRRRTRSAFPPRRSAGTTHTDLRVHQAAVAARTADTDSTDGSPFPTSHPPVRLRPDMAVVP